MEFPKRGVEVRELLHQAMLANRWDRISRQEDAAGTIAGIDWTVRLEYTRLGTMTGTLQIGATVNDGESVALDQLAQWTNQAIQVALSLISMFRNCVMLWCSLWLFRSWGKSFFPVPAGTRSKTRPCSSRAGF